MASLPPPIRSTGNAGEYQLADGRVIKLVEWREGDFTDSVTQASGAVTAGTSLELFRDLANKNLQHSNLKKARNIPSQSELIMNRVGVLIAQAFSNTLPPLSDIVKIAYAASLSFKINDRLIIEGALFMFQSGYGMAGSTTENNVSLVTTGVPSAAAAPQLLVAQNIGDQDSLEGTIDFKNDIWITGSSVMLTLTARNVVTVALHGFVKKPSGA
jgi:hypothetical protein